MQYIVTGSVAVVKTEAGSERYLYRGAVLGDGFKQESIDHLLSIGLLSEKAEPAAEAEAESTAPPATGTPEFDKLVQEAAEKLVADKAAADKAAADKAAADKAAAAKTAAAK